MLEPKWLRRGSLRRERSLVSEICRGGYLQTSDTLRERQGLETPQSSAK